MSTRLIKVDLTELQSLLMKGFSISEKFAKSASERLLKCGDKQYLDSVINYIKTGIPTYLAVDKYNTDLLQSQYNMDYLNSVLMLVWIVEDTKTALSALDSGYDEIVG